MTKLGQNFLISKEIVDKVINTANPTTLDTILEIGPGRGIFTEKLVNLGLKVIAVEKDMELTQFLMDKFKEEIKQGKLEILNEDILKFDPKILKGQTLGNFSYKIIASIPFYITGAILKKFLSSEYQPTSMTLIVQKEVAERIVAKSGKESILSISVKAHGEPKIIKIVPKKFFKPQPKVNSAILHIGNISKDFFTTNNIDEDKFFKLVKTGFSSKRKYLSNNLKKYKGSPCTEIGLSPKIRAEELKLEDWRELYRKTSF